jgi:fumarate hydratase, class I
MTVASSPLTTPERFAIPATPLFSSILELIRRTSTELPVDVSRVLTAAQAVEKDGSSARVALDVISCNVDLAGRISAPLCQDTGSILFYVKTPVGYDHLHFSATATEAVREATRLGYLRQNSVDSLSGKNSGDNTGPGSPNIHFEQWRSNEVQVILMLKGGGSENVGIQFSLPDPELGGRDIDGVENAILKAVVRAQGEGCSPGILGVTIGGDRSSGWAFAKKQFFRTLDDTNPDPVLAELETRVMEKANRLGIGPMGFGGKTSLLGCKVAQLNRVPASFYVTVAYMCWAFRRRGAILSGNGEAHRWLY